MNTCTYKRIDVVDGFSKRGKPIIIEKLILNIDGKFFPINHVMELDEQQQLEHE